MSLKYVNFGLWGLRKKAQVVPDRKRTTTKVNRLDGWRYLDRTHS
ncbi:hypothetical protein Hanom_Chr03g00202211 [Helianthus anomalus]